MPLKATPSARQADLPLALLSKKLLDCIIAVSPLTCGQPAAPIGLASAPSCRVSGHEKNILLVLFASIHASHAAVSVKRHRSGGEQKVTVQYVHVNEGGQAIVGNVKQHRGEG